MSQVTPRLRKVADLLVFYETRANFRQGSGVSAAYLVCEKLRPPLATLMGNAGFRALLLRALTLASVGTSWSGLVKVRLDGSLEGWDVLESRLTEKQFAEASGVLVARLLGLLVAFIGDELTFRQLREIWPEIRPSDGIFTTETKK